MLSAQTTVTRIGAKRDTTTELVSRYPPTYLRHHALAALPHDVFALGNRDGIGRSKHVLQKIASEGRNILRLDSDIIKLLQILRHTLIKVEMYKQALKGYIQEILVVPFRVVCFTEGGGGEIVSRPYQKLPHSL